MMYKVAVSPESLDEIGIMDLDVPELVYESFISSRSRTR